MNSLQHIESKITTIENWKIAASDRVGKKVVFTNGCFDVLHRGHVEYLAKAKDLGDLLVVGLNTDASVRRLKGESRPVNNERARALSVAALEMVDFVIFFSEDTPYRLIQNVMPDVLVKGADYSISNIVGADLVLNHGGEVRTIEFVDGYSSSSIISKMQI